MAGEWKGLIPEAAELISGAAEAQRKLQAPVGEAVAGGARSAAEAQRYALLGPPEEPEPFYGPPPELAPPPTTPPQLPEPEPYWDTETKTGFVGPLPEHLLDKYGPQQPTAPQAPTGPAQPRVPGQFRGAYDGMYFSPDHVAKLTKALDNKDITPEQYDAAVTEYGGWLQSGPGLVTESARRAHQAQMEAGVARQAGYELQARGLEQKAQQYAVTARQDQQRHAEWAKARQRLTDDYRRRVDQYRAAQEKVAAMRVDPDKFWEKRGGVGGRVLAALFAGMGAMGSGFAGMPNFALQSINKAMDDELASQRSNIQAARGGLADQRSLLGMIDNEIGDLDASTEIARSHIYQQLANKAETFAASVGSRVVRTKAAEEAAKLRGMADNAERALRLQAWQWAEQKRQAQAAAAAAAAAKRAEMEKNLRQLQGYRPLDEKEAKFVIPGWGMAAPVAGENAIRDLRNEGAQFKSFVDNTARMEQLLSEGNLTKGSERYQEYKQLYATVANPEIKRLMGNATQEEMERATPMFGGSPDSFLDRNWYDQQAGLRRWREIGTRDWKHKLKAYGVSGSVEKRPNIETGRWEWMVKDAPSQQRTGAQLHDKPW